MPLPLTVLATLGYCVFKSLSAAPGGASYPVPDALAQLFGGAAGNLFHGDVLKLRAELTGFITGRQPDSNQDLERGIARSVLHADLFCLMEAAKEPLKVPEGKLEAWMENLRARMPEQVKDLGRLRGGFLSEGNRSLIMEAKQVCEVRLQELEKESPPVTGLEAHDLLTEMKPLEEEKLANEALLELGRWVQEKRVSKIEITLPDRVEEVFRARWFGYVCGSFRYEIKHNQPVANILSALTLARLSEQIQAVETNLTNTIIEKHTDTIAGLQRIEARIGEGFGNLTSEIRTASTAITRGNLYGWALPIRTDYFVGRDDFLQKLHTSLREKRKVLISASGGYGKTQAALEYAHRYHHHYEDILWVRAGDSASLFESYRELAKGLERLFERVPAEADVQRALKSWLAEHPNALVIFDNLDNLSAAKPYWPTSIQRPFIIVTSQSRDISELDEMHRLDLDVWDSSEALDFLKARTKRPNLDENEKTAAATLSQETGFMPLALEQAAAYIERNAVTFTDYLRTYARVRLKLLERQHPVAGDHTLSVAATWKATAERLPEAARQLLAACSHLANDPIPMELVTKAPAELGSVLKAALTDETEVDPLATLLGTLQHYSLLRSNREARTFSAHKLLGEVMREDQTEAERSSWVTRWVKIFETFPPSSEPHLDSPAHSRAWPSFEALFLRLEESHPSILQAAGLADLYVWHLNERGRGRDAERVASRVVEVREKRQGPEHEQTLVSMNALAVLYLYEGRYAESERLYLRLVAAGENILGTEHSSTLTYMDGLAYLYRHQGRYADAERLAKKVLAARERLSGPEDLSTLFVLGRLAGIYELQGRYAEAEPLFVRQLEATERILGPDHRDTAMALNNLGNLYIEIPGRDPDAEKMLLRARAIDERLVGPDHPDSLISKGNLANLYTRLGRHTEAEQLWLEVLASFEKVSGSEHPDTLITISNLGEFYSRTGRFAEAEPLVRRAIEVRERTLGKDHPDTLVSVDHLGGWYQSQCLYEEAGALYQRVLFARGIVLGWHHPDTLNSVNGVTNIAVRLSREGRHKEAEALYRSVVTAKEQTTGQEHPDTLTSLNNLANCLQAQGRHEGAQPLYESVLTARRKVLAADHPDTVISLNNLANCL
jgi:tetratricopeptide (TPR) repeat protein